MNTLTKLFNHHSRVTLKDLASPNPNWRAKRAIRSALKAAKRDQDEIRRQARQLKSQDR